MIELPLIFVAGFLGSSHCVGMCGPFALAIGTSSSKLAANITRQLVYSAGRIFTYLTFGAVAGYAGLELARRAGHIVNVPAVLAIGAGGFLLVQGLATAGVWKKTPVTGIGGPCLATTFLAFFLTAPGWTNTFLAGLFSAMLPCGLVYSFVALASSTGDVLWGATVMGAFGLGTVPLMLAVGTGGSLLTLAARQKLLRLAAWCVVLAGLVTIARGIGLVLGHLGSRSANCLLCF